MEDTNRGRTVPFFDYPHVFASQEEDLIGIIRDIGRRGAFILQRDLASFEGHLAEYLGAKHVRGVANCTDGLLIALRALEIGPGDEVVFCSHTFVATASAIHFAGATPVPVECGPDHLIDPASVEAAITDKTKAIMPTQLNGRTCDMAALQEVADRYGLVIVEDAAQSVGAKYKGKSAGTFGVASAVSFYPAKTLGCLGDGGAVITSDDALFERISLLSDHGRDHDGEVQMWGINSRLDNLQAGILDYKLSVYGHEIDRRREIASLYQRGLGDLQALTLPPAPGSHPDYFDIFQNFEVEAEQRDELHNFLKDERGIGTLVQWGGTAVHQLRNLGFSERLPFTEGMFTRCLMLPMNTSLSNEDVRYVCEAITDFYAA